MAPTTSLLTSGPHPAPHDRSLHIGSTRDARIARHLAWCELMHRDRLAAAADLRPTGTHAQHLRLLPTTTVQR